MHNVRYNSEQEGPKWIRAFEAKYAGKGTFTKEDWDDLLGDSQAVCDIPGAFFVPELVECYPDAKVIILNRDPEKWYNSVLSSIHSIPPPSAKLSMLFCIAFDSATRAWIKFGMTMHKHAMGFNHRTEKEKALAWYERLYKGFRESVPKDRRIDYTVGDGWGPLCAHLGVPVPMVKDDTTGQMVEEPFPHLNSTEAWHQESIEWRANARSRAVDSIFRLVGKAVLTGSTAYLGYLMWKTRIGGRL